MPITSPYVKARIATVRHVTPLKPNLNLIAFPGAAAKILFIGQAVVSKPQVKPLEMLPASIAALARGCRVHT